MVRHDRHLPRYQGGADSILTAAAWLPEPDYEVSWCLPWNCSIAKILAAIIREGGQVAYDIIQLVAVQRVLSSSRVLLRPAVGQNKQQTGMEIFEANAIWPIIGHITWLFKLWDQIIARIAAAGDNSGGKRGQPVD